MKERTNYMFEATHLIETVTNISLVKFEGKGATWLYYKQLYAL